ncbi:hypothetical protein V5F53_07535 [Xanthobacter sp. V4C-4]|uniref:hypothetical protein n=1 Tax=Xanthobacter cornucopiae TaxID=3119924 RepID=UPI00372C3FA6
MRGPLYRLSGLALVLIAAIPIAFDLDETTAAQTGEAIRASSTLHSVPPRNLYRAYEGQLPRAGRPLTPTTLVAGLEARGFSRVDILRRRGHSMLAEATGPRGERARLVVDTVTGEITGLQLLGFAADDDAGTGR